MLISNLNLKYSLVTLNFVRVRVTAVQAVGSITSTISDVNAAILPYKSCLRTTFPRVVAGSNADTIILAMDYDING